MTFLTDFFFWKYLYDLRESFTLKDLLEHICTSQHLYESIK